MNHILVTGATGTIGSDLVSLLRERDVPVRAFVRDPDKAASLLGPDVELAVGDFADPGSLRAALTAPSASTWPAATIPRRSSGSPR